MEFQCATLTAADNPRLGAIDYQVLVFPDGSAYALLPEGRKELKTSRQFDGLLIFSLAGVEILLTERRTVLVEDEIANARRRYGQH